MKIIIFDTETTGLPSTQLELEKQPHVCQFAAIIYECDGYSLREIRRINHLIKPPVSIPQECVYVHGISDEKVANSPSFSEVADIIVEAFHGSDVAVAHNISFDEQVIQAELKRLNYGIDFLPSQTFDTMKETKELCRLPGRNPGTYKSPRLLELYQHLFGTHFEGAHDAMYDVEATGKCLAALLSKGIFKPQEPVQNQLF
ncbi:hypothetical protein COU74_01000 [Candidatus Peregrinibacteria bacterium CG10_big_fil_rev_8_21_14_0_10_36_19]|nr:MAG: hypothetical protein COU74_01000 [Candidatus Peregrinibacteria bacterium CG10_big_fil_rev_8_21_14_0_10_36_19]